MSEIVPLAGDDDQPMSRERGKTATSGVHYRSFSAKLRHMEGAGRERVNTSDAAGEAPVAAPMSVSERLFEVAWQLQDRAFDMVWAGRDPGQEV